MYRLSSNLSLFFKFFIPVFWTCFFLAFTIAAWFAGAHIGPLATLGFKIGLTLFTLSGILMFYFTVWRLKRVDANTEHVYISNYFKTMRIEWDRIARIDQTHFFILTIVRFRFVEKTYFGRHILFLASAQNLREFREAHEALFVNKTD